MPPPSFDSRSGLNHWQLERLNDLLRALQPHNAFYAPRLASAGLMDGVQDLEEFRARMPFTTKAELVADQKAHPPYGSNLTYPLTRYCRFNQTSASCGEPLRWLDDSKGWNWMLDHWDLVYAAAGATARDRFFFAFSFGPFLGFWTAFEAAARMGALCIPGGGLSSAARMRAILDNQVTILCCTPTYALRLADAASEVPGADKDHPVRAILVAGEPGGSLPAIRKRIEKAWPGAAVYDHHGMTEVGPVSYACPKRPETLRVIESSYLAEVVDPASGRAVPPGQSGELVLSTLGRAGSPLLRYRTGDVVRQTDDFGGLPGRVDLGLQGGILGRCDDMLIIRGVNLWPAAVDEILQARGEADEYQVQLDHRGPLVEMRILIETRPGLADPAGAPSRIEADLRRAFNLRIPVTLAAPNSLPRFEMKARRWVRL